MGDDVRDDDDETERAKVAIATERLHLISADEAVQIFDSIISAGSTWASPLMQYRTTSDFQKDWKVEVGNWLERAQRLGYLEQVRRNIVPQHQAQGERQAGDPVHRGVVQQLTQAMVCHYMVGTGWRFHAWEPIVTENRRSGIPADVDLQLMPTDGVVVDFQVKASGHLGLHDNQVDPHEREHAL